MKRSEVIPAIVAAITTAAAPAEVVRNDYSASASAVMDAILIAAGRGIVAAVEPIQTAAVADTVNRGGFASKSAVAISLRMNPQTKPAGVTADTLLDIADAIIVAVLAAPGLEASISGNVISLVPADEGLLTYDILFTVTTDTP